jgi:hypothetical protein
MQLPQRGRVRERTGNPREESDKEVSGKGKDGSAMRDGESRIRVKERRGRGAFRCGQRPLLTFRSGDSTSTHA